VAADASQNALIRIVRGLDTFERRSKVSTWVYRIAMNSALDELRARARRPRLLTVDESIEERAVVPDGSTEDRMLIEPALAALSEEFRVVVVLRDLADLEYDDIAEILEIPIGTVRSRLARGRRRLADILADADTGIGGNSSMRSGRPIEDAERGDVS
jgi:RNA polymerase sigma-70 factor (ECF subfamily)